MGQSEERLSGFWNSPTRKGARELSGKGKNEPRDGATFLVLEGRAPPKAGVGGGGTTVAGPKDRASSQRMILKH